MTLNVSVSLAVKALKGFANYRFDLIASNMVCSVTLTPVPAVTVTGQVHLQKLKGQHLHLPYGGWGSNVRPAWPRNASMRAGRYSGLRPKYCRCSRGCDEPGDGGEQVFVVFGFADGGGGAVEAVLVA